MRVRLPTYVLVCNCVFVCSFLRVFVYVRNFLCAYEFEVFSVCMCFLL